MDPHDFAPRFPWLGGDLQTLRYYFFPCSEDLSAWPSERLSFPLPDAGGDALLAMLHRPRHPTDRPLVILVHGLTGCEGSSYMFETTRSFLNLGYPVMRLNLRGAGPSRDTCSRSYCGGSGDNVAAVLSSLEIEEARRGVVLIGFSLGGTVMLHCLARYACEVPPLCAVTVSTPLDLAAVIRRLMNPRNVLYHRWLLARWFQEHIDVATVSLVLGSLITVIITMGAALYPEGNTDTKNGDGHGKAPPGADH